MAKKERLHRIREKPEVTVAYTVTFRVECPLDSSEEKVIAETELRLDSFGYRARDGNEPGLFRDVLNVQAVREGS